MSCVPEQDAGDHVEREQLHALDPVRRTAERDEAGETQDRDDQPGRRETGPVLDARNYAALSKPSSYVKPITFGAVPSNFPLASTVVVRFVGVGTA